MEDNLTKILKGKWKVGLYKHIYLKLSEIGIPSTNIKISDICTFESTDRQSCLYDKEKTGCMFVFIGLK